MCLKKILILVLMISLGSIFGSARAMRTQPIKTKREKDQAVKVSKQVNVVSDKIMTESTDRSEVENECKDLTLASKRSRAESFCAVKRKKTIEEFNTEANFANSLCDYGKQYYCGIGVVMNRECAKKYFEQAAKLGSERALVYLSLYYYSGPSATQDVNRAEEYFQRAMPFVVEKIKKGVAEYECFFGYMKEHGLGGQSKNIVEAIEWYKKAAMKGNTDALNNLGVCYHAGKGVPRNCSIAKIFYEKAAASGNVVAQYNLGCYYEEMKNNVTAAGWFRIAAVRGYAKAQNKIGEYSELGIGVPIDYNAAIYWYKKATEQGDELAKFNLMMIQRPGVRRKE